LNLTHQRLEIKSSIPSTSKADPSFAVLCSPTQTYLLRQQQTSNSLFVICPTPEGIHTITTCTTTLELVLQPSSTVEAYLTDLLPSWPPSSFHTPPSKLTRTETYNSTPHSTAEIDQAFRNLNIFTDSKAGHCYIPTSTYLLHTWNAIVATGLANSISLDTYIVDNGDELFEALGGEEECPRNLFDTHLRRATGKLESEPEDKGYQVLQIWLARVLLEEVGPSGLDREEFRERMFMMMEQGGMDGFSNDFGAFESVADLSDSKKIFHRKFGAVKEESKADGDGNEQKKKKQTWHERFGKK
jgi:hypothetical protein